MPQPYPRDMIGYGRTPPDPQWPNRARVAVQFVINYEEGAKPAFCTAIRRPKPSCQKLWEQYLYRDCGT